MKRICREKGSENHWRSADQVEQDTKRITKETIAQYFWTDPSPSVHKLYVELVSGAEALGHEITRNRGRGEG